MISQERRDLADLLDGFTDEQWNTPSLCAGWRVREVVAHLAMPFSLSLPRMMLKMAATGFDFNRLSSTWAINEQRPNAELVGVLRANAENRFTPPGFGAEAPLTDVVTHGQDIRRPLGLPTAVAPAHAIVALDLLVSKKATRAFVKKGLLDGLAVAATDADWSHGSGAEIRGTSAALITAIAGRRVDIDELSGDGVSLLRTRTGVS
ncbi:MAG: maleylpyruvate isomerase family mycothiol-dependent enzyme [Actinobacteria bacterium]|nr:maleylpyruvate isomerase family mycothiol-dependent enzyme [Actinomycetota bacterium]